MVLNYDPDCLICQLRATVLLDMSRRSRVLAHVAVSTTESSPARRELFMRSLTNMMALRRDLDSLCEYPHHVTP